MLLVYAGVWEEGMYNLFGSYEGRLYIHYAGVWQAGYTCCIRVFGRQVIYMLYRLFGRHTIYAIFGCLGGPYTYAPPLRAAHRPYS